jgi:hypothetical protein
MGAAVRRSMQGAFALLVAGIFVVAAFVWLGRSDPEIEPATMATSAAEHATAVRSEGATEERPLEERDGHLTADAPGEDAPTAAQKLLTIEVRDTAGRLVERSYVSLRDEANFASYQAENGVIRVPFAGDPAPWRVTAGIPGSWVSRSLLPFSGPDVVTVQVGDTGTLRVHCEGTSDEVDIQVFETRNGTQYGAGRHARSAGAAVDMKVAAGSAEFRVTATAGEWTTVANTVGPRGQSDVVEVTVDFQIRRVTGRLVGGAAMDEPTRARAYLADGSKACFLEVDDDGAFVSAVPRGQQVMLVLMRADEWGICRVPASGSGDHDVGPVVMAQETYLGTIEVRDAQGTVWLDNPRVLRATMADGSHVVGGLCSHRLVFGKGIEVFGAPGVVEAVVGPGELDRFWSPATMTVRDGRVGRVDRIEGARVVVCLSDPAGGMMGNIRLQNRSTNESYGMRDVGFDAGRWWGEFLVPPGRYAAVAEGEELVGGAVEVTSGSEQEITVSVRPR